MDKHRLAFELHSRGKTASDLAQFLGISACSLSRKCNGKSEFTVNEVKQTMLFLDMDDPIPIFYPEFKGIFIP